MSLLDGGARYEACTVFLEELAVDEDGNKRTHPSVTGTPATARFQLQFQSGTSARRSEQDNEGYESEKVYEVRFPRSFTYVLGAQSEILWNGARWALFGDQGLYNSSWRTRHRTYVIKRY